VYNNFKTRTIYCNCNYAYQFGIKMVINILIPTQVKVWLQRLTAHWKHSWHSKTWWRECKFAILCFSQTLSGLIKQCCRPATSQHSCVTYFCSLLPFSYFTWNVWYGYCETLKRSVGHYVCLKICFRMCF
jgi:hypothetical protein